MLDVDKIDNASINYTIQYIAGSTADDQPKTNIFITPSVFANPEID